MVDSGDVIRDIERVRFTPVRMREGYDMGEVDEFLDRLVEAARAGRSFGAMVAGTTFTRVRLREGYDIADVDTFLARMAEVTPVPDERANREAAATPATRELVARIRGAQFHGSFFREGYATAEVDPFLASLADAALAEQSLLPLLDEVSFARGRFRSGYAPEEVDGFLRALTGG